MEGVPLCLMNAGDMSVLTAECVGGGYTAPRNQGTIVFGFLPSPLVFSTRSLAGPVRSLLVQAYMYFNFFSTAIIQ